MAIAVVYLAAHCSAPLARVDLLCEFTFNALELTLSTIVLSVDQLQLTEPETRTRDTQERKNRKISRFHHRQEDEDGEKRSQTLWNTDKRAREN